MVEAFLTHLKSERRLSSHTLLAYETDLRQCRDYLSTIDGHFTLEQAAHHTLRAWIVDLVKQGVSNRSINRKISSLKTFYSFLLDRSLIAKDPATSLKRLKTKQVLPVFLQEKELIHLLDHHPFADSFEGARDKLVLELLYGTGLRLSELLSLTDDAVDTYNQTIRVLGKRNKERVIPYPRRLNPVIDNYQSHRDATIASVAQRLLVTKKGAPCYPRMIYELVNTYLRTYTQADRYSPHVLRHTFATHLLNRGADLNSIKELLGHESLAATQLYTHHSLRKLQEVFSQAHPRA